MTLCVLLLAGWFDAALAQKANYPAAARAATPAAEINSYTPPIPKTRLEQRRDAVLAKVPAAEQRAFRSNTPDDAQYALNYYGIVEKCLKKNWQKCGLGFFYLYVTRLYPMMEGAVDKAVAEIKSSDSK